MFGSSVFIIMFHCYNQSQEKPKKSSRDPSRAMASCILGCICVCIQANLTWLYRQTHVRQNLDTILGSRNHVLDLGHNFKGNQKEGWA